MQELEPEPGIAPKTPGPESSPQIKLKSKYTADFMKERTEILTTLCNNLRVTKKIDKLSQNDQDSLSSEYGYCARFENDILLPCSAVIKISWTKIKEVDDEMVKEWRILLIYYVQAVYCKIYDVFFKDVALQFTQSGSEQHDKHFSDLYQQCSLDIEKNKVRFMCF